MQETTKDVLKIISKFKFRSGALQYKKQCETICAYSTFNPAATILKPEVCFQPLDKLKIATACCKSDILVTYYLV